MKKILIGLVIISGLMVCNWIETHYTRKNCTVVSVTDTTVTVEDKSGYLWSVEGNVDNLQEGEKVNLKMYTNGTTENITDDIILKIKRL